MLRDVSLVASDALPSCMSFVQSSSSAEKAKFPRVGQVNGCSRGVNEAMPEIPATSNTPPFGQDHSDHRERFCDPTHISSC